MNSLYYEELALALALMPENTLWAIGSMEDGPFARLCLPQPDGGYSGGYVESVGESHTVPQAIRKALAKA